jgi:hypothetical protein
VCYTADADATSTPLLLLLRATVTPMQLLYKDDPTVTRQGRCMAVCVFLLAIYQMVAIGLIMSQTLDIINLISNFVGVTIVTQSDELIAGQATAV